MTTRGKTFAFAAVVLPLVGVGSYLLARPQGGHPAPPPGNQHTAGGVRVRVVEPREGGVERTLTRPAAVHPFQYADLYAKVSGYLHKQTVDIGSVVKKGELLAEIYAPEITANVKKAKADLAKAKSDVQVREAGVKEARADLREARAKLEERKADLESARATTVLRGQQYRRIKNLAEQQAIEQELVDEKMEARRTAQASERAAGKAVTTAEAGISAAEARLARAQADLDNARAEVQVAEASLEHAQAFEEYTSIRSPYDGVVTQRNFHEGDLIRDASTGGTKPVLAVARTDLMRVVVWVPDPDVPFTHKGDPATLRVDALSGRVFKGKVARTASSEAAESRSMRTEVDLPNPDGVLESGMFGSITLDLGRPKHGLSIPSACLVGNEKDGKRAVYVVRDGKAHKVTVEVGRDNGIRAAILSGLLPDDRVIEQHGAGLADGVAVEVAGEGTESGKEGHEKAR